MEGQPTGSGASYAGPGAQSFWTHRDDAMYREGSELPDVKCRQDQIG